jgi:AcrR family transcriptional regulator
LREGNPISRTYDNASRREEAAKTRRRILDTARRLFAQHGYVATSVARIAQEAEVAPQTIYNRIGSKRDLLAALMDVVEESGEVAETQRRIAASRDPREVVDLVARLRRLMMEGAGDIIAFTQAAAAFDADVGAAYAASQARSRAGVARFTARLASLNALRSDLDADSAADVAYAFLHHAIWTRLVDECGWSADEAERWHADVLARMLMKPEC